MAVCDTVHGDVSADEIIALLELRPHPEGGHFRETFRDNATTGGRSASTAIYFLLREGEQAHWHKVDAAEVWHHYAGAPLLLEVSPDGGPIEKIPLGHRLLDGERPQLVVLPGCWQRARSLGAWTLCGCTVAPGFTFEAFSMAPPDFDPVG